MFKIVSNYQNITRDIQAVQQHECHEAFSRVMDEHIDQVRRVVYRIVLNAYDTDDIVQETFIKAFHKIDSFKGAAKFSSWLCRIAYNEAYLSLRKKDNKLSDRIKIY